MGVQQFHCPHCHNLITEEGPPLGVCPRFIWEEKRLKEIDDAIVRYLYAGQPIPGEWNEERTYLISRLTERR